MCKRDDDIDLSACTLAYGDAVEPYENGITFDIDQGLECISVSGCQFNLISGPKAKDGTPLCIHCFVRFKS